MKIIGWITILLCGSLLIYNTFEFPDWSDPASPASTHLSPYYIENTINDTAVPNIVTSVLADYRGYDTMYETTVVLCAGIACFFLLRVPRRKRSRARYYRHEPTGITLRIDQGGKIPPDDSEIFKRIDSLWVPQDIIIETCCRLMIPFIQIFALYVVAHGHHSPGGGFQGGVLLGASIILIAISKNLRATLRLFNERVAGTMGSVGVFIYAGTGALCLILGKNFLDYSALASVLGVDKIMARSHGILIVEIGVALAVMAVMVWIYYNLSSAGKHDEGL